jgi:prepilin-type N-terminal cleavage/methylation domain-containing protein
MRRGFTLVETVLALAVAGVLLAIALPALTALKQGVEVEQAAQDIAAAHRRARISAIVHGRPVVLSVDTAALRLTFVGAAVPHWSSPGPSARAVIFAGPPRELTFSPIGITTGLSNATFHLSRGSSTRAVVVSRLGRVRIVRSP